MKLPDAKPVAFLTEVKPTKKHRKGKAPPGVMVIPSPAPLLPPVDTASSGSLPRYLADQAKARVNHELFSRCREVIGSRVPRVERSPSPIAQDEPIEIATGFDDLQCSLYKVLGRMDDVPGEPPSLDRKWVTVSEHLDKYNIDVDAVPLCHTFCELLGEAKEAGKGEATSLYCMLLDQALTVLTCCQPTLREPLLALREGIHKEIFVLPPITTDNIPVLRQRDPHLEERLKRVYEEKTFYNAMVQAANIHADGEEEIRHSYMVQRNQMRVLDRVVLYWQTAFLGKVMMGWRNYLRHTRALEEKDRLISHLESELRQAKDMAQKAMKEVAESAELFKAERAKEKAATQDELERVETALKKAEGMVLSLEVDLAQKESELLNLKQVAMKYKLLEKDYTDLQNMVEKVVSNHLQQGNSNLVPRIEHWITKESQSRHAMVRLLRDWVSSFIVPGIDPVTLRDDIPFGEDPSTELSAMALVMTKLDKRPKIQRLSQNIFDTKFISQSVRSLEDDSIFKATTVLEMAQAFGVDCDEVTATGLAAAEAGTRLYLLTLLLNQSLSLPVQPPAEEAASQPATPGDPPSTPSNPATTPPNPPTTPGKVPLRRRPSDLHRQIMAAVEGNKRLAEMQEIISVTAHSMFLAPQLECPTAGMTAAEKADYTKYTEVDNDAVAEALADDEDPTVAEHNCKELLSGAYRQLRCIFKYYHSSNDTAGMTREEFEKLLQDCQLLQTAKRKEGLTKADLQKLWAEMGVNSSPTGKDDVTITPQMYSSMLLKVASIKFDVRLDKDMKSHEKLRNLLECHVLPKANYASTAEYRESLQKSDVQYLLNEYKGQLAKVFVYCAAGGVLGGQNKNRNLVTLQDFKRLMDEIKVVDENLSYQALQLIFTRLVGDMEDVDVGGLKYSQFIEVLCAVALYKYPAPYLPIHHRIRRFFDVWLFPALGKRLKLKFTD